jgi:hypothetical protein
MSVADLELCLDYERNDKGCFAFPITCLRQRLPLARSDNRGWYR